MLKSKVVFDVMGTIARPCDYPDFFSSYFFVTANHFVNLPAYFHQMYRILIGLATSVLLIIVTTISQRGNALIVLIINFFLCVYENDSGYIFY